MVGIFIIFIIMIGLIRSDRKQSGRETGGGIGKGSWVGIRTRPERNDAVCWHAAYKATGAKESWFFWVNQNIIVTSEVVFKQISLLIQFF